MGNALEKNHLIVANADGEAAAACGNNGWCIVIEDPQLVTCSACRRTMAWEQSDKKSKETKCAKN